MARSLAYLSLFVLLAAPAQADPAEQLEAVFAKTVESRTQTVTFFRGLAGLPNLDVSGEALAGALRDSKIDQAQGMLGAFVSGMKRFVKKGDRVTMHRDRDVDLATPNGVVHIPKKARVRIRLLGAKGVKLDKMRGSKAGKTGGSLHPLRWLELSVDEKAITTARLNAGYGWGFNKTITIVLKRPTPPAPAPAGDAGGLAANLPG